MAPAQGPRSQGKRPSRSFGAGTGWTRPGGPPGGSGQPTPAPCAPLAVPVWSAQAGDIVRWEDAEIAVADGAVSREPICPAQAESSLQPRGGRAGRAHCLPPIRPSLHCPRDPPALPGPTGAGPPGDQRWLVLAASLHLWASIPGQGHDSALLQPPAPELGIYRCPAKAGSFVRGESGAPRPSSE